MIRKILIQGENYFRKSEMIRLRYNYKTIRQKSQIMKDVLNQVKFKGDSRTDDFMY